jgi:hypothetical protein
VGSRERKFSDIIQGLNILGLDAGMDHCIPVMLASSIGMLNRPFEALQLVTLQLRRVDERGLKSLGHDILLHNCLLPSQNRVA